MKIFLISLLAISGAFPTILNEGTGSQFLAVLTSQAQETPTKSPYIKQKEVEVIDAEMESLLNLRDYYTSKMTRYRARATRYELQGENLEESKLLSMEADKLQDVINQIDEEIARLEQERTKILKS